jgi:hypothetical protein
MKIRTLAAAAAAVVGAVAWSGSGLGVAKADVMVAGLAPGLCLDVNQANNQVILYGCHNGPNQNFFTSAYGQQRFNGRCLDMARDAQGAALVMTACSPSSTTQRWGLSANGVLRNERGWCADIPGFAARSGQQLVGWSCNGGRNQVFGRAVAHAAPLAFSLKPGQIADRSGRIIGQDVGSIIGQDVGSIIGQDVGSFISTNGGNLRLTGGAVVGRLGGP